MFFNHWAERLNLVYHALFGNLYTRLLRLVDTYLTQKLCSFLLCLDTPPWSIF